MTANRLFRAKVPTAWAAAAAMLLLAGCAGTPATDALTASPPPGLPSRVEIEETPFFAQTKNYCAPASLAAALNFTGLDTTPDQIGGQVFTPGREGSLQSDVIGSARRQGRLALPVRGLQPAFETLAAGQPVLILQNLGLEMAPQWHYALLVGYDLPQKRVILRSGTLRRLEMPLETFEHTWRRADYWGLAVVAAQGPVPPVTSSAQWTAEAAGLERAGRPEEAEAAYRTASETWPDKATPLLALANLHYAHKRLEEAQTALRRATLLEPDNDAAWNNLANVLLALGRLDEAEEAARQAVTKKGPHLPAAEKTLQEVLEKQRLAAPG